MKKLIVSLLLFGVIFTISYSDFQDAVNKLSGEIVGYKTREGGGYILYLLHERLNGTVIRCVATGTNATNFDVWKSTCYPLLGVKIEE